MRRLRQLFDSSPAPAQPSGGAEAARATAAPVTARHFRELERAEARASLDALVAAQPRRVDQLRGRVGASGPGIRLDLGRDSLVSSTDELAAPIEELWRRIGG